jgi:hypothetical protein
MASLEKTTRLVSGMIVALIAGTFLLDLSVPRGAYDWALYLIPLCITFWLKDHKSPLLIAASCTVLIYVELVLTPPSISFANATVNRSFGVLVLWLVALLFMLRKRGDEERVRLIGKLQDAMAEIKVLQGILTICSRCKKIRDEKGLWLPVEVYVGDRSSADFSHVICPDCLDEHFTRRA